MAEAWRQDFRAFFSDMGSCPPGFSLDRIDVNGDYAPGNCRWIPWSRQSVNRRTTRFFEHDGRTQSMSAWAREWGMSNGNLCVMLKRKSFEEIARIRSH